MFSEKHSKNRNSSECLDVSLEGYTSSVDSASEDSDSSASDKEIEDEKLTIFNFYKTLSTNLLDAFSIQSCEIDNSLRHVTDNYKRVRNGALPTEIDYTEKSNCIAYLHRYAACHTAVVFHTISEWFKSSSSAALTSRLNKKSLNVVFLGGGPGNDFVGFLTALFGYHHYLFDLDVTIVDKKSGWEDVFHETMESLRQGNGGKAGFLFEEVNIQTTFISADLKDFDGWDEIMQVKLKNADLVFLVKVLSHVPGPDKQQVLQNIVTCMQVKSLLIYIDSPFPEKEFALLRSYLRLVYQSNKEKYIFKNKGRKFGHRINDHCTAVVKAFEKI